MDLEQLFGNKKKPKIEYSPPKNYSVILKAQVDIDSKVNEIFATTKVTQKIHNNTKTPVELDVYINKNLDNIIFSSFNAKVGNSLVAHSKVIKKEKAEEKYTDSIASGNAAIFTTIDKDDKNKIIVHIGNIPPNEELLFTSEFIQFTEFSNNSYEYELFRNLPKLEGDGDNSVRVDNDSITGSVEIKSKNKIIINKNFTSNQLVIKEEKFGENNTKFIIKYRQGSLDYTHANKIYFKMEKYSFPMLFSQKSRKNKKEQSLILNYKLEEDKKDFKKDKQKQKQENIKLSPALFIFLLDQSGSMSGSPIKVASKALLLFLQSLPAGSYYQIIGFGSNYKLYDPQPKEYNSNNIKESIKIVETLKGNMGGTNIYDPLKYIYNSSKIYDKILLPKNIFLLTDGEIDNKKDTLNIIEKNSNEYAVYAFGMGNSFDEDLIKNAGIVGKGSYSFCKKIEGLNQVIASTLNNICVSYIRDFKIDSSIDKSNLYELNKMTKIIVKNKIYQFYYITEENSENKKLNFKVEYCKDKEKYSKNYEIQPNELFAGEELSKLIIYNYISKKSDLSEEEKIKLALKYQLFIEGTSLFAEIELSEKTTEKIEYKEIIKEKKETKDETNNKNLLKEMMLLPKKDNNESRLCKLDQRIKVKELKINNLEEKTYELQREAKEKLKNGDEAGAKRLLSKKEIYIDQIKQIEGAIAMMEEQKMMLDNTLQMKDVMSAIKNGNKVVKDATHGMNIEDLECMKECMEEKKLDQEELKDFFRDYEDYNNKDRVDESIEYLINNFGEKIYLDPISNEYARKIKPYINKIYAIKPNKTELEILSDMKIINEEDLHKACDILINNGIKKLYVTLGEKGALYYSKDKMIRKQFKPVVNMVNASGAGDSFFATIIFGNINNFSEEDSLEFAMAAGILTVKSKETISPELSFEN